MEVLDDGGQGGGEDGGVEGGEEDGGTEAWEYHPESPGVVLRRWDLFYF